MNSTTRLRSLTTVSMMVLPLLCAGVADAQSDPNRPDRPGTSQRQDGDRPRGDRASRSGRQASPSQLTSRLMRMDTDGDGRLSRDEVGETRFAVAFDTADANGDGYLTKEEITLFVQTRRPGGPQGARGDRPDVSPPNEAAAKDPRQAFDEAMSIGGRALRGLRRTKFEADTFERDLDAVLALQTGLFEARRHLAAIPMSAAAREKFGGDEASYRRSFQRHLATSLLAGLQLEIAILDGDATAASEIVQRIVEDRNRSHDLFEG